MSLQEKAAPITGGNRGIGLATARRFAAEGVVRSGQLFLLDGKRERDFLFGQGNLTGVAYAEMQERVPRP